MFRALFAADGNARGAVVRSGRHDFRIDEKLGSGESVNIADPVQKLTIDAPH